MTHDNILEKVAEKTGIDKDSITKVITGLEEHAGGSLKGIATHVQEKGSSIAKEIAAKTGVAEDKVSKIIAEVQNVAKSGIFEKLTSFLHLK